MNKNTRNLLLGACAAGLVIASAVFLSPSTSNPAPVGGIVSLAPSVTEILFGLGAGDRITGATPYCNYPPEARDIPRVGDLGSPNLELLLSMQPELVIAAEFEHKNHPDILRRAGIEVLIVPISNMDDVFNAIDVLGEIVHKTSEARELRRQLEDQLQQARNLYQHVPPENRPRVYIEVAPRPIMTIGRRSFVHDIIELAGGVNVAGDIDSSYPVVSPEMVVQWNPDVMLVGSMTPQSDASALSGRIGWSGIKALRTGRVINDLSPDLYLRPGPRLATGVLELARRLYPPQYPGDGEPSHD